MKEIKINTLFLFVLPILSGVTLAASSLPSKFYFLNFIVFIPLLIAANGILQKKRQYLNLAWQVLLTMFAFIRAIENRRYIAHSSNMGISAFINQKGEVLEKKESKQSGFLKQEMRMNKANSHFASTGNLIGKVFVFADHLIIFGGLKKWRSGQYRYE